MADHDIGDVIVVDDGNVSGIVTDRDIVVRAIAKGSEPKTTRVSDVLSGQVQTLGPDASIGDAVRLMTEGAIRRIPVVEGGRPIGIVSIGDLAVERDADSALADISAANPNN
jgi:CBS domain-containing protein